MPEILFENGYRKEPKKAEESIFAGVKLLTNDPGPDIHETWVGCTERSEILKADPECLIWCKDKEEMIAELNLRNPAPEGFTYVKEKHSSYGAPWQLVVMTKIIPRGYVTCEQVLAAVREGHDLNSSNTHSRVTAFDLLVNCGYTRDEARILMWKSRMKDIPLLDDIILRKTDNRGYELRQDAELFKAAVRNLKSARSRRVPEKKGGKRSSAVVYIISLQLLKKMFYSLADIIRRELSPSNYHMITFNGPSVHKSYAAREVMHLIALHGKFFGSHAIRKNPVYKEMISIWADELSRNKMREQDNSSDYIERFMNWLDVELVYCRDRRWKFARDLRELTKKKG